MTPFEIPLSPSPQTFFIPLGGVSYKLSVGWNVPSECWVLDIATSEDVPVLSGIPLVTGVDLLEQYAYVGIGGSLYVQTDHDVNAVPTFDNLGLAGRVFFVTEL